VIVFSTPGDPNDDPDPIPPLNVDVMRPTLNDVFLAAPRFSLAGTTLHFALDDSSVVGAEVWHVSHGHRAAIRSPCASRSARRIAEIIGRPHRINVAPPPWSSG
jgi:hypothetical protein